ncbi:MAG: nucleotidyltransferase domain-containing protein [Chloroflexi bacterium]|nr:nucleotidyltransferase domain-containing protein [Chloroflexota bacterium]
MEAHHQRVIDRLTALFQPDPNYLALIIGGSIARGWAKPDSDVDIVLVVTDEEYRRRAAADAYHYFNRDICDYEGGYVDGKIVNLDFLREAADHGSEPARAAFVGAFTAFSRCAEVDDLLKRIPVYPEHERDEKIRAFYSQVLILNWYVPEAEKRRDPYLLTHAASELALYGGRLILAHNRILYPYHKWFMHVLREAPDKPADFMERMDALLVRPGADTARAFTECVGGFRDWGVTMGQAVVRFMRDSEWNWRYGGRTPLADW